jgi:hypothetical protein
MGRKKNGQRYCSYFHTGKCNDRRATAYTDAKNPDQIWSGQYFCNAGCGGGVPH